MQFERLAATCQNVHHSETEDEGDVFFETSGTAYPATHCHILQPGMTGYTPAEVLKTHTSMQFFKIALTGLSS
jgi:hypothetical protein